MVNRLSGVYRILNLQTGKVYVGSSQDVPRRLKEHRTRLRAGIHHSKHLQAAWEKHGEAAFVFQMIASVAIESLTIVEQTLIDEYRAASRACGYNSRPVAENNRGHRFSAEVREKVAAANRGRKASAETRAKMSAARKGIGFTSEQRANMSAAKIGRPRQDIGQWAPERFRQFDDSTVNAIRADRAAGQTYAALATKYGCLVSTAHRVVNRVGLAYS